MGSPIAGCQLQSPRLTLRLLDMGDAEDFADYLAQNRHFHSPWDIDHNDEYFQPMYWASLLAENVFLYQEKRSARIGFFLNNHLIGMCHIAQVLVEPIHQAEIGYHIDHRYTQQGLMFEALSALIPWTFDYFKLERLVALVIPKNQPSKCLLEKLGFVKEGCLREYLTMRERRVDHLLFTLLRRELDQHGHFS
ncbi:GNAT family N-acetyltransferase [Piscirickettsia litoralis]|uniref:GNAT family N-acetyltransferase n=1 Tax=Piscirickettsia litoralis TaxID=1891921 RepID=UPI001F212BD4|nr:GNAT family protein [Piscirickettsia litoralis]